MIFNWPKKEPQKDKAEVHYIKPDGSRAIGKDAVIKKGIFSASHKWARSTQSIARTLSKDEMRGWLSKNVVVQPNEVAVVIQDGRVADVVDSGKIKVGGLSKTDGYFKDVEVIMMDTSPKDANWQVGELWTSDQHEVAAKGLLRYRIADPHKFFSMIYAYSTPDRKGERFLSLEDINERIKSEVLTRVLQPGTGSVGIEEFYGNLDFQHNVENELELQLKQTLCMWGLELLLFTTEWNLGDYTSLNRARRQFEKEEELKELDTLAKEGDLERSGRLGIADVRAQHAVKGEVNEFGRRQRIRDAEAGVLITQKESESDFEDAKRGIEAYSLWKQAKTGSKRAELLLDQEIAGREHARDLERLRLAVEKGGQDAARIIAEGREYSRLSPAQIEAIAKARESEARAKEDRLVLIKEIEDRERGDAYRRQDLDAKLMYAAKPVAAGAVKKCPHCGSTLPGHASFCWECGESLG